jgi:hypothetical protein
MDHQIRVSSVETFMLSSVASVNLMTTTKYITTFSLEQDIQRYQQQPHAGSMAASTRRMAVRMSDVARPFLILGNSRKTKT